VKKFTSTYYISKFTVISFFICLVGGIFTVKGLVNEYHRVHAKTAFVQSEIRKGHYVEYDISYGQLLRTYHKGLLRESYSPVCNTDAYTMDNHYFVATGKNKEYYIDLVVPPEFQEKMQQFIDGETKTYHVYGRIEKLKFQDVYNDSVMEGLIYCTGIRDKTKLNHMVSEKYQLKVMDASEKGSMWYKGLIFFAMGLLGVLVSVEKNSIFQQK